VLALCAPAACAHERSFVADRAVLERTDPSIGPAGPHRERFEAIRPRRVPAALAVLVTLALAWAFAGARVGALTLLWAPTTALAAAALGTPSLAVELAVVGPGSAMLAWLTDRMLPWPRGLAAPALIGVAAHALDLVLGSDLIVRSLLGPDPSRGARFYGIGNELEAILPVLALLGVAALAPRRPAAAFVAVMAALGVVVGAGRLGADVGGVVTVGVAGAVAVLWCRPGRPSRRAAALAAAVPVAALAALAAIDLATNADTHFSRTILGADSLQDVARTIGHRYELAWDALLRGLMPLATVAAVAAVAWAVRRRRALYAPVAHLPAWRAALAGSLAGAVAGTLSNDSGPVLLVLAVVVLAAVTAYVRTGATRTEAVLPDP
jgi:hypothetical protein